MKKSMLTIQGDKLLLDGQPFRIFSGAMHYFRTHPKQWEDRLKKLKAMGLNCIETYVPWNLHEEEEGVFKYEGLGDIVSFLTIAQRLDLHVILRPGPYICAEWEFGGLPAWLLNDPDLHLRCANDSYMRAVNRYFSDLFPRVLPFAAENGGPIIAVQVENEYGSYGQDKVYLGELKSKIRSLGYEGLLFTSDGPTDYMMANGTLDGVWKTANFGSKAAEAYTVTQKYEDGPFMCMEYWIGWFDHWGEEHHIRSASSSAESLDEILTLGGHVNIYMAHGGTNFEFWSGANSSETGKHQPTTTSYDYDAPLDEAGRITQKYLAVQQVLKKHGAKTKALSNPEVTPQEIYAGNMTAFPLFGSLLNRISHIQTIAPQNMERLGHSRGYVLYSTDLVLPPGTYELDVQVHDRGHIFLDDELLVVTERNDPVSPIIKISKDSHRLSILVENQGRINYGKLLADRKGIIGSVWVGQTEILNWEHFLLPTELPSLVDCEQEKNHIPAYLQFEFNVSDIQDLFLKLDGWGKGVAYVNGFNLGRYWEIGPQNKLYIPSSIIHEGTNELVLFETDKIGNSPLLTDIGLPER
ncbi:beta-galactosidase [Parasalinivibrio latis]|uniref:glycoside hydrolase family 35 protein n=1 Tax=Parasalinivibrio latis TaxID=2952610 RepID=UPI0030E557C8